MPEMYEYACVMLFALKNIHTNTVSVNVASILNASFTEGNKCPFATIPILFSDDLESMVGIIKQALMPPQKMKVQLAPCQNPLTKKITNTFLIFCQVPPLLPPSGI